MGKALASYVDLSLIIRLRLPGVVLVQIGLYEITIICENGFKAMW